MLKAREKLSWKDEVRFYCRKLSVFWKNKNKSRWTQWHCEFCFGRWENFNFGKNKLVGIDVEKVLVLGNFLKIIFIVLNPICKVSFNSSLNPNSNFSTGELFNNTEVPRYKFLEGTGTCIEGDFFAGWIEGTEILELTSRELILRDFCNSKYELKFIFPLLFLLELQKRCHGKWEK